MTIQQAIEKAIEGGYNTHGWRPGEYVANDAQCVTFLDPLFWQSLGKAMGWSEWHTDGSRKVWKEWHKWKNEWHRFIDHLAEGKDAESFFESL